ncbi:isoprenoid synthase domain-containing protein [Gloeopeniophorella convolvens]|nr:isoprenoid synthase domain-containing protein [Gloeopeniophorella convolvens]
MRPRFLSQLRACAGSVGRPSLGSHLPNAAFRHASTSAAPTEPGVDEHYAYCRQFVQKHDYESYLVGQLYPADKRKGYFAIKAFYDELATIPDTVSNNLVGEMRMQFWRDAVKGFADGRPPHHPIALALYDTSRSANLSPYHLKRIIDARTQELKGSSHLTMDSLIAHAESTASTHYYLLLSLLGQSSDTVSHAASHLGAAHCISTLLRALPYHASKGRMVIPAEVTAKHGVSQEEVFRKGPGAAGIDDAVFAFASTANDHIVTAREMFKDGGGKVPRAAMPVFGAGVPIASFLERLEVANFDVFHPSLRLRSWKLPWRVWRSYYNRTF